MISNSKKIIPVTYSIDLYAINLKKKVVPEKHAQMSIVNHQIRRLTPEGVATRTFGFCP